MMQMTRVAIGLGSNKGDRAGFLLSAFERLSEDVLQKPVLSKVHETAAWGGVAQHPFLNAVAVGETDWKPPALVNYLKELERELGRTASERYGDREIDLDLLAYGEEIWKVDGLEVPHPGVPQRDFVLIPLSEVWPQWRHPGSNQTVLEMLSALAL